MRADAGPPKQRKGFACLVLQGPRLRHLGQPNARDGALALPVIDLARIEALSMALSHGSPIHLLLTDVMMPGMSGSQLAKKVHETLPGMKVIYISGFGDPAPEERVEGALFLQKPFTLSDLLKSVRQAIES